MRLKGVWKQNNSPVEIRAGTSRIRLTIRRVTVETANSLRAFFIDYRWFTGPALEQGKVASFPVTSASYELQSIFHLILSILQIFEGDAAF
jgi:hypothetical protein